MSLPTVGDRVKLRKGNIVGFVRFNGEVKGKKGVFYGIECDEAATVGRNDGYFKSIQYFNFCKNRGLFVKRTRISKINRRYNKDALRVAVGDKVKCLKTKCDGIVRFIGIPYSVKKEGVFYGIELEEANGKNNGTINGRYYFKCKDKYGIFVQSHSIMLLSQFPSLIVYGFLRLSNVSIPTDVQKIIFHFFIGMPRKNICGFLRIGFLGKGEFGAVTLVFDPYQNETFAFKKVEIQQKKVITKDAINSVVETNISREQQIMDELYTDKFLVSLQKTYRDSLGKHVYFIMDACLGGNILTELKKRRYFNEPTARFYIASVCEGLDYMHSKNIILRNLKPGNLILDSKGYLKIANFEFAKKITNKTYTLCGTPDYLCPEIVTGQGHGKGCDWWTVGILIYHMLASFPPFIANEPIETYRKILRGRIRFPRYFTEEVRDLIRGLLHKEPSRRMGVLKGGVDNIRRHVWFKDFNFDELSNGTMPAPIINNVANCKDLSNFDKEDEFQRCWSECVIPQNY